MRIDFLVGIITAGNRVQPHAEKQASTAPRSVLASFTIVERISLGKGKIRDA